MLVLTRRIGEKILIGDGVVVLVQRVAGGRVKFAIDAPRDVTILRGELKPRDRAAPGEESPSPSGLRRAQSSRRGPG